MARQEVPEAGIGTPEEIEKDTFTLIPLGKETYPGQVIICDACGKGFLNFIPGSVDTDPLWMFFRSQLQGGICGGALVVISRETAIEIADRYEKIGGEAWLRGQRRP
jgi:hypothetical protein